MNSDWGKATKLFLISVLVWLLQACASDKQDETAVKKGTLEPDDAVASFVAAYFAGLAEGTASRASGPPLQMSARVGPASDPAVCENGELYGPYVVSGNSIEGGDSARASQPSIRLANQGELAICMIVTSPVDATLDVETDSVFVEANECDQDPAYIGGVWQGDYSCSSSCGGETGSGQLTILQDGYTATYSDGEAYYEGNVCGNEFTYSGGADSYTESGTFILNSDGTGSKTSSYQSTLDDCTGTCSDPELIRISNQVLFDDFTGSALDPAYLVVTDNTQDDVNGWVFGVDDGRLQVTDVTPNNIHNDNDGNRSQLILNRAITALSDFLVEFEFSWDSDDVSAMQYFNVQLHPDGGGPRIAYAGYADGWVSSNGQQASGIAEVTYASGIDSLPASGRASVKIIRQGNNVEVLWNGTAIQSHESTGSLALGRIIIIFSHYPYDSGTGAISSFGAFTLDSLRISGTLAP